MLRKLLGLSLAASLLLGFFAVYFAFSGFRAESQPYTQALSDFLFLGETYHRRLLRAPPEYSDAAYERLMRRFTLHTHWDVRDQMLWTLAQWGEDATARLRQEIDHDADPPRLLGAAQGLATLADPQAARLITAALRRHAADRRLRRKLLDALAQTGDPAALPFLTQLYREQGQTYGDVLSAIGHCGGSHFLLEEFTRADGPAALMPLIWPLAATHTPAAAAAIGRLLLHPDEDLRVRAYSAMRQTMGPEVVAPLIAVLRETPNEYVIGSAIGHVLGWSRHRSAPQLVPFLAEYLEHPTLAWEARYALARVGGEQAIAALTALAARAPPDELIPHLEDLGPAAIPILGLYLEDPHPAVRRQAIGGARDLLEPAVRPLLERGLGDSDRHIQHQARMALFELDRLDLLRSFTEALPDSAGRAIWHGFRGDLRWGQRRGFTAVLEVFAWVHLAGLLISALLGLLLVLRRVRVFDSYRFQLFVCFLLAQGLIGNALLLPAADEQSFVLATGVHLLLLCGVLFQERERAPGELRGRFETLGGASLWLMVPPLLLIGTPLIAEGLRLVLRDITLFLPGVILAGATTLLVLEQWALPWRLLPRSARLQRWLAASLSVSLLLLFLRPLWLVLQARLAAGDTDGATLTALLMAPLLWMGLYYLTQAELLRSGRRCQLPAPPERSRLQMLDDGERISLRPTPTRTLRRGLLQGVAVFGTGAFTAGLAGIHSGGGQGMLLAMIAGLVGAALAGLIFDAVLAQPRVQLRRGYARAAMTHFGAALGGGHWFRNPARLPVLERVLAGDRDLSQRERAWLRQLQQASA